jgi:hypothetical protein
MSAVDFIIFVVYLLVVSIVLYQAYNSLEDRVRIRFDGQTFQKQLQEKQLEGILSVGFGFREGDRYLFDEMPKDMSISIVNKLDSFPIKVDWDRCSLSDVTGRSRRVVRLTTGRPVDLSEPQLPSFVAPLGTLQERVTAEELVTQGEDGRLIPKAPIININKAATASFMAGKSAIRFALWLTVGIPEVHQNETIERLHSLPCYFLIEKTPWQEYLPFYGK